MQRRPEFLDLLGLVPPCTREDVKQAYLLKVKEHHPDHGGSQQQFLKIQEAYERSLEYATYLEGHRFYVGSSIDQYLLQQECLQALNELGCRHEIEQLDWLISEIGEDFAQLLERIVALRMTGPKFGDEHLKWLTNWAKALGTLRRLDLTGSRVTATGLAHLVQFPALEQLRLNNTSISYGGLGFIAELPKLTWLELYQARVGRWGRWRLRRRHPGLIVSI